ncbi:hypothetical protein EBU95_03945 [bacterium]|nr:hypothetical protein [bacterium]
MKFVKLLLIFSLLFPVNSFAGGLETDKVAHFGLSYAIQTGTYGVFKHTLKLEKPQSVMISFLTTVLITSAKEGFDSKGDYGDVFANVLGASAASATILMFDF